MQKKLSACLFIVLACMLCNFSWCNAQQKTTDLSAQAIQILENIHATLSDQDLHELEVYLNIEKSLKAEIGNVNPCVFIFVALYELFSFCCPCLKDCTDRIVYRNNGDRLEDDQV